MATKEIVEKFGEKFERTGDGWLHATKPDRDGEWTMTPDHGEPSHTVNDDDGRDANDPGDRDNSDYGPDD